MTPFHVGMRVVCVEDQIPSDVPLMTGGVYEISGFYTGRVWMIDGGSELIVGGLRLVEVGKGWSFKPEHFRPAHENRMDELRTLLAPVPSKAKTLSPVTS